MSKIKLSKHPTQAEIKHYIEKAHVLRSEEFSKIFKKIFNRKERLAQGEFVK